MRKLHKNEKQSHCFFLNSVAKVHMKLIRTQYSASNVRCQRNNIFETNSNLKIIYHNEDYSYAIPNNNLLYSTPCASVNFGCLLTENKYSAFVIALFQKKTTRLCEMLKN